MVITHLHPQVQVDHRLDPTSIDREKVPVVQAGDMTQVQVWREAGLSALEIGGLELSDIQTLKTNRPVLLNSVMTAAINIVERMQSSAVNVVWSDCMCE